MSEELNQKKGVNIKDFLKDKEKGNLIIPKVRGISKAIKSKSKKVKKSIVKAQGKVPNTSISHKTKKANKTSKVNLPIGVKKDAEYLTFLDWCATPAWERKFLTQKELAVHLRVEEATLSDWKRRKDFKKEIEKRIRCERIEKASSLIGALEKQILTSNKPAGRDILVWLQYVALFNPKIRVEDETPVLRKLDVEARRELAKSLLLSGLVQTQKDAEKLTEGYAEDNYEDED